MSSTFRSAALLRVCALLALSALIGCAGTPQATALPATIAPEPAATIAPEPAATIAPEPAATIAPATAALEPTAPQAPTSATAPPEEPTAEAATGGWTKLAPGDGPAPRADHSAVLDPVRQRLVVFGGRDTESFGDTWILELETGAWRQVSGAGPPARFGHGAVYDAANQRMIIVMGQDIGFFNDVWAFDLERETWTELKANDASEGAPRKRYGQSAALDSQGRVLISHGFSDQGRFDDTWAFDPAGGRWLELTPASGPRPLKRCLHELAYDAAANRLIMFGGCSSGFGPCPQGDLWAFDVQTNAWTELTPAGDAPSARSNPSMVYDAASRSLLLFGGKTEQGPSAETWRYDLAGNTWTKLEAEAGPSARSSQAIGADPQRGRAILFGGRTAQGASAEVWEW